MAKEWKPAVKDMVWVRAIGVYHGQVGDVVHIHGNYAMVRFRMHEPRTTTMVQENRSPVQRHMTVQFWFHELGPAILSGLQFVRGDTPLEDLRPPGVPGHRMKSKD